MNTQPLADEMKEFRLRRGWSQMDLSHALGISIDSVQNWEQRRTYPKGFLLTYVQKFLDLEKRHTLKRTPNL